MEEQLESLSIKRKKAQNILIEKEFFQTFNSFFEACTGFSFTAELNSGTPASNWIHVKGEKFIKFLKEDAGVCEFSVNDLTNSQKSADQIVFSKNFETKITLKQFNSHLTISIADMVRSYGTFTFLVDDDSVYSGRCERKNIDYGLGKIVVKHRLPQDIERVVLKKRWVNEILPEFSRIVYSTKQKIIDFETQELKKKRLDELADNIAIDDFE